MPRPLRRFRPVILFFFLSAEKRKEASSPSSGSGPHFLNHSPLSASPHPAASSSPATLDTHPRWDVRNREPSSPAVVSRRRRDLLQSSFPCFIPPALFACFYETSPTESPRSSNNPPHLTHQKRKFDALPLRRQTF